MKKTAPLLSALEDQVVASASSEFQSVVLELRQTVFLEHPEATVLAWPAHKIISFGYGPKKMTEHYAFIAVHPVHVNLGLYHGVSFQAVGLALEGTGKALRHIKVRSVAEAQTPALAQLIQAAREHQAQLLKRVPPARLLEPRYFC
jgi:hypothetical protein